MNDALDDWLAQGLDGLSASTVTLYRRTIAKALRQELGTIWLTDLAAGRVQAALRAIAARMSTRTVAALVSLAVPRSQRHQRPERQQLPSRPAPDATMTSTRTQDDGI